MGSFRPFLGAIGAVALGLTAAGSALAEDPPPPPPPSISQYVESVPTATGGASRAVTKPHAKPLAPAVARRLRNSDNPVVKDLNTIATSSTYGAPQHKLTSPAPKPTSVPSHRDIHGSTALTAAVSAVSDSGDSHVYWLLAAVIVITTSMVWAAGRRHRA